MNATNVSEGIPQGLSDAEVKARIAEGKVNTANKKHGKSYLKIVLDNLLTFFNLVWAIVAAIMIGFGSFGNLTFAFVVVPNILLAIIQEARAKAAVDKLSVTTDPKATVVRDGELIDIPADSIVLGDVMRLEISRQILSDAVVISGVCEVNESMLTGESVPVKKQAGDRLFAGSFLVSGSVYAEVTAVGSDNYVNTLETQAKKHKAPTSNLFRSLDKLIRCIGIFMVPITVGVAICNTLVLGDQYSGFELAKAVAEKTCGSVIGMIPAGMYLLITVTLSLSVMILARRNTLVQDMYSIEMLARADVLCLDKTGTITDGTMRVKEICSLDGSGEDEIAAVMAAMESGDSAVNATSKALIEKFGQSGARIKDQIAFSSSRKYSAADIDGVGIYALGAPHFVPCEVSAELDNKIAEYASRGERVLLLSRLSSLDAEDGAPLALIALEDRIRPGAEDTIRRFQEQDVTVKVISGDHAQTVSAIAVKVGINDADKYISCENLTDDELIEAVEKYAVFGRVTPEQKVIIVNTMKKAGHTVAMTGDGVNDTLALKEANCAIAMADGSEVARAISQIVLMDSDFSHLPEVVREGRRCINNVRGSAALFVMKTIFTMLISVFSVVTLTAYPFAPNNFLFLEFFVIGIASFLLAFEPNNKRIEGNFIEYVMTRSLPYAIAMFVPTLTLLIVQAYTPIPMTLEIRDTICMIVVTLVGYINLTNICRPYTKWRVGVAVGIGVALLVGMVGVGLLDHFLLGGSEFAMAGAFKSPVVFALSCVLGVSMAFLMHLLRDSVGKFVGFIARKLNKSEQA
ncbi:MAG: HAD-IC family P-type ATPase [Clostridia bacterium]|nr:HAD-IC family P-type ATPase [Clostridia bacterium]